MADQPEINNRIGFHYYPDTLHYRDKDLQTWLPELKAMGAAWITLVAHPERAIPEPFISGLLSSRIEPVIHFQLPLPCAKRLPSLELLLETYARWGVRFAVLFDRPNLRQAWAPSAWTQSEVAEQFLDFYIPLASRVMDAGLRPVFPPLEPGGNYWDTVFLQTALRGILRRGNNQLLDSLVLSAYAWTGSHPLDWGIGGPERWPLTYPYRTPDGSQDQLSFRIFDWYLQIASAELGTTRPLLLLRTGYSPKQYPVQVNGQPDHNQHAQLMMEIAKAMHPVTDTADNTGVGIPPEVLACNFWLLAADSGSPYATQAWFQQDGIRLPAVAALRKLASDRSSLPVSTTNVERQLPTSADKYKASLTPPQTDIRPIPHYLLVPLYAWGISDWDLETIRPIIEKFHPTVGFSIEEAQLAKRVTIAGDSRAFSEKELQQLRNAGCVLDTIEVGGKLVPV